MWAGPSLAVLALLATDLYAWLDGNPSRKNPVPEASALAEAAKLAKDVYGDEYAAAKAPAEKRQLARKLLVKAGEIENDLPGRYVLLRLSRDIATQALDIETAFLAVEQIDRFFAVSALELKREVLVKSAALARTPAEHKVLVEKCFVIFDQAVANDDFPVATQLGPLAIEESPKCNDQILARQVPKRIAEIEQIARNYEKMKAAMALLDKVPDDPEANLTAGGYLCFTKGRWEEGIPMLALGKDPALKAVAIQELDGAKTPQDQLDLADQWRDLAEAQPAAVKTRIRERALLWYRRSLPGLAGLAKSKAELRIKELGPKEVAIQVSSAASNRSAENAKPPSGYSLAQGDYRRWQVKGGDSPLDAELKRVEHAMVVLKKKADDQIVTVAFDNLCDGDQVVVSDWTLRESDRIWDLETAKIGPRDSREAVKAKELAKALDGACVRTVFSIDQTASTEQGKSGAKLKLSGSWGSKLSEIVLPLPQAVSAQIARDAKLVVMGRLNIKYAACPLCGGTGLAKCPNCSHGVVYHTESKPIVFPNGQRIMENVQVAAKCPKCGGTGHFGQCEQHKLQAWEPFGTRKLPQGSFFTFTDSNGARRVCFALDEPRFQILSAGSVITLRRAEGKIDIQTAPAKKSDQAMSLIH
jgi:hypothetical protein